MYFYNYFYVYIIIFVTHMANTYLSKLIYKAVQCIFKYCIIGFMYKYNLNKCYVCITNVLHSSMEQAWRNTEAF